MVVNFLHDILEDGSFAIFAHASKETSPLDYPETHCITSSGALVLNVACQEHLPQEFEEVFVGFEEFADVDNHFDSFHGFLGGVVKFHGKFE